jgi:hypothetical protein
MEICNTWLRGHPSHINRDLQLVHQKINQSQISAYQYHIPGHPAATVPVLLR